MGRPKKRISEFPYKVDSGFELVATGRWNAAGVAQLLHRGTAIEEDVRFPRGEFNILAQLMRASEQAALGQPALAFVPSHVLAAELFRLTSLGDKNPQNIHKTIDKLRKRFMQSRATQFALRASLEWSDNVIETHPLGYRLSLPPQNQHLDLLDPG